MGRIEVLLLCLIVTWLCAAHTDGKPADTEDGIYKKTLKAKLEELELLLTNLQPGMHDLAKHHISNQAEKGKELLSANDAEEDAESEHQFMARDGDSSISDNSSGARKDKYHHPGKEQLRANDAEEDAEEDAESEQQFMAKDGDSSISADSDSLAGARKDKYHHPDPTSDYGRMRTLVENIETALQDDELNEKVDQAKVRSLLQKAKFNLKSTKQSGTESHQLTGIQKVDLLGKKKDKPISQGEVDSAKPGKPNKHDTTTVGSTSASSTTAPAATVSTTAPAATVSTTAPAATVLVSTMAPAATVSTMTPAATASTMAPAATASTMAPATAASTTVPTAAASTTVPTAAASTTVPTAAASTTAPALRNRSKWRHRMPLNKLFGRKRALHH